MIKFGTDDLAESMRLALEAAKYISATFVKPIQLEFEKCYFPYLLISKKRYAGLFWTKPTKLDKIDAKGIETVRRDNAPVVSELLQECLNRILIHRDVNSAIAYTKTVIQEILQNKMDLSMLVISKSISKSEYKAKQAHVELANRMRKRDPSNAPGIGDRVPYVIIRGAKGAPAYERAEDPLYVLEHGIPVDTSYYVEQQLKKPLTRIFKAIMPDPNQLFVGDHTRHISISAPRTIGIGSFAVRSETCIGCRVVLENGQKTLCDHCRPKTAVLYKQSLETLRNHEHQYSILWTQCQTCQGSLHQPVYCTNSSCPIFYRRKKVAFDLKEASDKLARFSLDF